MTHADTAAGSGTSVGVDASTSTTCSGGGASGGVWGARAAATSAGGAVRVNVGRAGGGPNVGV